MPAFSDRSLACYATLHPDLQRIADEAIKLTDFSIIWGFRDQANQDEAFNTGKSNLKWPTSKHNIAPSHAMDLTPYPLDWSDTKAFYYLAGVITTVAANLGITIRWGGTFTTLKDIDHFELA